MLCWVFVSVREPSPVAANGGHSSSRCVGLSLSRPLLLRSTGSRRAGSVVVTHGPSCPAACGIFPDQGSNPCPLHWQAASQPLHHQGSPVTDIFEELMETEGCCLQPNTDTHTRVHKRVDTYIRTHTVLRIISQVYRPLKTNLWIPGWTRLVTQLHC